MKKRLPAVAGYFYPATSRELLNMLSQFIKEVPNKVPLWGCIVPHAGYIYSGKVAGAVYSLMEVPDVAIIIGPNHNGLGYPSAIYSEGIWTTPLGDVEIDSVLSQKILQESDYLKEDALAHQPEHSLEVQVPFLQYINPNIKIVPITVVDYSYEVLKNLGYAISQAVRDYEYNTVIIASSDFSHYEPHEIAKQKDLYAIESILNLDEKEFIKRVVEKDISICGVGPIVITMIAVKLLGSKRAKLVEYQTSGNVTRDFDQVVGYAGIIFPK
ncbi:MAG: AmmeMemoRadiSam system protein B [Dictyoglomus thermophilum]|uniref:MEMO1 family protein ENU78_02850 n=1 Tax=Dictyoglomus thermophilum TaxID=14 RepID=A0A7V3ZIE9_DICTH|nr:AmmeMemoRadiSam system protein B [Dictyoglomus thermophilum]MCX7719865.1 AmmeMemoRadiSam system protein B [Dictyoglomus thermophilum]TYT22684.1 AmmeMemoRadiSam system protein B [Dictyoglomus thermophilum]